MIWIAIAVALLVGGAVGIGYALYQVGKGFRL